MNPIILTRTALLITFLFHYNFSFNQVPILEFQQVLDNKIDVVDIVNAHDGSNRIFLVHLNGSIQVYSQSFSYIGEFLTLTDVNTSGVERGLFSLAFHPDYNNNGYVFIYYTAGPNGNIILARYKRSAINTNAADPNSRVVLLDMPKPITFTPPIESDGSHNGGKLNFGADGYLYFAIGDGGSGYDVYGNAENGNSLFGKMLRINVNSETPPYYTIPPNNPFVNDSGIRDEIWGMGLRNPWRWSFDRLTHDIWLGDVGQRDREEVNFVPAGIFGGISFGWHCFEGSIPTPNVPPCTSPNYMPPVFDYPHEGGHAIIGGYVYRGQEYPSLYGYYICGDFSSKNVWLIKKNNAGTFWEVHLAANILPSSIFTFGEAENGTLYLSGNDGIYKVAAAGTLPVKLLSFTLTQGGNYNLLRWKTAEEMNLKEFALEFGNTGIQFRELGRLAASNANGSSYSFNHNIASNQRQFYRLRLIDNDGAVTYSKIISSAPKSDGEAVSISPTISSGRRIQVHLNESFQSLLVYNIYGQLIQKIDTGGSMGLFYLDVQSWKKGVYILIARNDLKQENRTFTLQ